MCYPKPGPRCSAHAEEKLTAALNKSAKASDNFFALKTADPEDKQGKQQTAKTVWIDAQTEVVKAKLDYDATPNGLKQLKEQLRTPGLATDQKRQLKLRILESMTLRETQLEEWRRSNPVSEAVQKRLNAGFMGEINTVRAPKSFMRPTKTTKSSVGSKTAVDGYAEETRVAEALDNWQDDAYGKAIMNRILTNEQWDVNSIESSSAVKILDQKKTDIRVSVKIDGVEQIANIQVKSMRAENVGFNQIDRRWAQSWQHEMGMPDDVTAIMKQYSGETPPPPREDGRAHRDTRRLFATEFTPEQYETVKNWFETNADNIAEFVFRGSEPQYKPDYYVSVSIHEDNSRDTEVEHIDEVIKKHLGNRKFSVTPQGTIKLGNLTIQRKGGDSGAPSASQLQVKISTPKAAK